MSGCVLVSDCTKAGNMQPCEFCLYKPLSNVIWCYIWEFWDLSARETEKKKPSYMLKYIHGQTGESLNDSRYITISSVDHLLRMRKSQVRFPEQPERRNKYAYTTDFHIALCLYMAPSLKCQSYCQFKNLCWNFNMHLNLRCLEFSY